MNEGLTLEYIREQIGTIAFQRRLLVWDTYRYHISEAVKGEMTKLKIDKALIPGGCTGLIQAPDVVWNKPFKDAYRDLYEQWMDAGEKTYTKAGNMRAPSKLQVVNWVTEAWNSLSEQMIQDSFKTCAVTNALDGSEDHMIEVLKEGKICADKAEQVRELGRTLNQNAGDFAALGLVQYVNANEDEPETAADADSGNELYVEDDSDDD